VLEVLRAYYAEIDGASGKPAAIGMSQ
jgi:hypothetical protein